MAQEVARIPTLQKALALSRGEGSAAKALEEIASMRLEMEEQRRLMTVGTAAKPLT